jgi:histidine kinase/DNA gyrase B/HSP90-like ATPase
LDDFGLATALRRHVEENKDLEISYEEALGEERLSPDVETSLDRIAQEAFNNVKKHVQTDRAYVTLSRLPGGETVRLEVRDEGRGFDSLAEMEESGGRAREWGSAACERGLLCWGASLRPKAEKVGAPLWSWRCPYQRPLRRKRRNNQHIR